MGSMNQLVFEWIHHFSGKYPALDIFAIFLAQELPYFLVAGFLILILYERTARRRLYLFIEGALAIILSRGIITTTIHFFYYHPRPFEIYGFATLISESGSYFPSGHAAWFFALTMVVWYANRKWGIWYFILATLMGVARIYAGVHWPLDVIAGAAIGIASGFAIHQLLKSFHGALTSVPPSASSQA